MNNTNAANHLVNGLSDNSVAASPKDINSTGKEMNSPNKHKSGGANSNVLGGAGGSAKKANTKKTRHK